MAKKQKEKTKVTKQLELEIKHEFKKNERPQICRRLKRRGFSFDSKVHQKSYCLPPTQRKTSKRIRVETRGGKTRIKLTTKKAIKTVRIGGSVKIALENERRLTKSKAKRLLSHAQRQRDGALVVFSKTRYEYIGTIAGEDAIVCLDELKPRKRKKKKKGKKLHCFQKRRRFSEIEVILPKGAKPAHIQKACIGILDLALALFGKEQAGSYKQICKPAFKKGRKK